MFTGCDELFSILDNPIQPTVNMNQQEVKLKVGDQYQRQAISVSPATIVYSSADPAVATVNANGIVTAIAVGTTTITASVAEIDYWLPASTSYKVTVVAKDPATITTAPVATTSIEPGSATALVTAGVANGGTMMYKVTAENTKPTNTDGFSAEVPTAAALVAGTYYVWYYAKADADHSDSEIAATAIEVKVCKSGLLAGKFSVSATKQVQFSQGNLQATYDGTNWTWAFAEHQWDYIGNAAGNTSINGDGTISGTGTVDLFGWVGASSTWTGVVQYGISNSTTINSTDTYGNVVSEALKSDWGNTIGSGWRTLTYDEWTYLLNTRTVNGGTGNGKSYTYSESVNGKLGVVIYPDDYTGAAYTTASGWATFEAAGCVFLPAAGFRNNTSMMSVGSAGHYWSSSSRPTSADYAPKHRKYLRR